MKISILSDFHFGYAWNSHLEEDSFQNAQEAIVKSLDSDLILIVGDIFDTRIPTTEVWAKALKTLSKPILSKNTGIKLVKTLNKDLDDISKRTLTGIPVVALHGTHERRGRDQINAIHALEQTGFLIHLHCNGLIFEKNGQKIAVQGMSGVPERYAKQVLDRWNPRPIKDCYNILMLHQSIEPYVYSPLEPPTLNLSNLPQGFDLIINGHIHTHELKKINDTSLLLSGSTIVTQLKEEEAKVPKGFYQLKLPDGEFTFIKLDSIRKFFFKEIILDEKKLMSDQIEERIKNIIKDEFKKKPLIKLKIIGRKTGVIDKELKEIEKNYDGRAILRFTKQLESPEITEKLEFLKKMREEKISLEEMGMQLLYENLRELKFEKQFDPDDVFKLLSDNQIERALNIITKKQRTLKQIFGEIE